MSNGDIIPSQALWGKESSKLESDEVFNQITTTIGSEKIHQFLDETETKGDLIRISDLIENSIHETKSHYRSRIERADNPSVLEDVFDEAVLSHQLGHVQVDVLKVFLHPDILGRMRNDFYNKLDEKVHDFPSYYKAKEIQEGYKDSLYKFIQKFPNDAVYEEPSEPSMPPSGMSPEALPAFYAEALHGDFIHFNSKGLPNDTDPQCYISFNQKNNPEIALEVWGEVLEESELKDTLHFKVLKDMADGFKDNIVIYKSEKISNDSFHSLLQTYILKCKERGIKGDNLLADDNGMLPATIKIAQGVSTSCEPSYYKSYLKADSKHSKHHTYNSFIADMLLLSLIVAKKRNTTGPIKAEAKKAFREFMILSGINPKTMYPQALGDELPRWTKVESN